MIEIFVLAAAQAVQLQRAPPVAVVRPEVANSVRQDDAMKANLLPDLIVSEVRVEDDSTAWFKITNQGTADAIGNIRLFTVARIGSRYADPPYPDSFDRLAMGESKWVRVSHYAPPRDPYTVGPPPAFPLTEVTAFNIDLDPQVSASSGGWFGAPQPNQSVSDMMAPSTKCLKEYGCVRELDEKNNRVTFEADRIGRGKPE